MAAKMQEVEVFVMIDADGSYIARETYDDLATAYAEHVGELSAQDGFRVVKVKLTVPLPELIEVTGTIPADEEPSALAVS